jgi:hypothetical protein
MKAIQEKHTQSIDSAAEDALKARRRIERAVENGHVPGWVLDTCDAWEQAALAYGAAMARRDLGTVPLRLPDNLVSRTLH